MTIEQLNFATNCSYLLRYFRMSDDVKLFVIAQLCLESNFGFSNKAFKNYNFSGMRYPLVRPSTAIGKDSDGFAIFPNFQMCVFDYLLCLTYHRPSFDVFQNVDSFKRFIQGWYCPEKDYIDKITKIFNQLKTKQNDSNC